MAKTAVKKPEKPEPKASVPARVRESEGKVPAHLDKYRKYAGAGTSSKQEDSVVPLIYVLQAQSPQVMRGESQIRGAEAGDIWLKGNATVWKGEDGIVFQPCAFTKDVVEWIPREDGGGFVGRFPSIDDVPDAVETQDPDNPRVRRYSRENGNELVEHRYHYGHIVRDDGTLLPAVISLSGTGHQFSREWTRTIRSFRLPGTMDTAPAWLRKYRLTTYQRKNKKGIWYGLRAEDLGWIEDEETLDAGTALYESVEAGTKVADEPDTRVQSEDADMGDDDTI